MIRKELNRKTIIIVLAGVFSVVVLGALGYNSSQGKSTETLEAKRDWQVNREMGIPISMEPEAGLSPEERKGARKAALEQSRWKGDSIVDNVVSTPAE
ncbi:hypothetical protein EON80_04615 [bacterium]|nr:MAG: hypothetical protein EON80_04615 [bacterium]